MRSKVPGSAGPVLSCASVNTRPCTYPLLRRWPWSPRACHPSPALMWHLPLLPAEASGLAAPPPHSPPLCTPVLAGRMGPSPRGLESRRGYSIPQAWVPTPPLLATLGLCARLTLTPEHWEGRPPASKLGRALGCLDLRPASDRLWVGLPRTWEPRTSSSAQAWLCPREPRHRRAPPPAMSMKGHPGSRWACYSLVARASAHHTCLQGSQGTSDGHTDVGNLTCGLHRRGAQKRGVPCYLCSWGWVCTGKGPLSSGCTRSHPRRCLCPSPSLRTHEAHSVSQMWFSIWGTQQRMRQMSEEAKE